MYIITVEGKEKEEFIFIQSSIKKENKSFISLKKMMPLDTV